MSKGPVPVGEVRPSQLLWTYGPGALIDLPNLSVLTMGLDRWDTDRCTLVEEARLLAAVRRILGPQVSHLRIPPIIQNEDANPFSAEGKVGVPVRPFPRFLRCVRCGYLGEYDNGNFALKENPFRPELTHFVHRNCEKGTGTKKESDAVPVRFLLACKNGHLDDFPWHWFVHGGPSDCRGVLVFYEQGASLQTENLWVECKQCGAKKSMAFAFGKAGKENLPACRGRHPHLDTFDSDCNAEPRAVLLGATNSWFPVTLSVLAIPLEKNELSQLILDGWDYFEDAESATEIKAIVKTLVKTSSLPGIDKYQVDDIWLAVQDRQNGNSTEVVSEGDIKGPEWDVLISPNPPTDWPHFLSRKVERPEAFTNVLESVLLLERLREVNALVGYTRVEAPEESADEDERPPMARLCRGNPTWVPASEVHGEGIFLRFKESVISEWEEQESVKRRDRKIKKGHVGWRNARRLDPGVGYPGIRYVMLHTLAHLLIRELALECGYNSASIRERIYAGTGDTPKAGILVYTAAADSDGTLGGLVELGKPENLGRLMEQALNRATVCSSDPLCSEHDPSDDRSLHAAACHACTFVAETSCERGNRYLDRALLVSTFECKDAGFFKDMTKDHYCVSENPAPYAPTETS
ncbi:DrmB family protein [Desulfoplanes sp. PS50]